MDVFSHGLWSGALFKFFNIRLKKKFSFWKAVFWGMFPDVFAFAIPFAMMFFYAISGQIDFSNLPHPSSVEPAIPQIDSLFQMSNSLYNISHSIIVFTIIFIIAYLIFKKPVWILGGWLLHILIDVPTHSYQFYPTPIFWPISSWKFDGFGWANEWFLIADAVLLIIVYFYLLRKERK
jgi:membrane-bound metal-dependent hydrolase YbcI (DUF457 family)